MKARRLPQAWGFESGSRIVEQPASAAVLGDWRGADYPIGNQIFSHLGLSVAPSLDNWIEDAKAGERALAAHMANADQRVLRFSFLDGGADPAHCDSAAAWLKSQDNCTADHSLSFAGWVYATPTRFACTGRARRDCIEKRRPP